VNNRGAGEIVPVDTAARDQHPRHIRDQRHQHLSGQPEIDPVRIPIGADGARRTAMSPSDKRLVFQYTTPSSSLQKKLGVNDP
jgi:hypothetical protein